MSCTGGWTSSTPTRSQFRESMAASRASSKAQLLQVEGGRARGRRRCAASRGANHARALCGRRHACGALRRADALGHAHDVRMGLRLGAVLQPVSLAAAPARPGAPDACQERLLAIPWLLLLFLGASIVASLLDSEGTAEEEDYPEQAPGLPSARRGAAHPVLLARRRRAGEGRRSLPAQAARRTRVDSECLARLGRRSAPVRVTRGGRTDQRQGSWPSSGSTGSASSGTTMPRRRDASRRRSRRKSARSSGSSASASPWRCCWPRAHRAALLVPVHELEAIKHLVEDPWIHGIVMIAIVTLAVDGRPASWLQPADGAFGTCEAVRADGGAVRRRREAPERPAESRRHRPARQICSRSSDRRRSRKTATGCCSTASVRSKCRTRAEDAASAIVAISWPWEQRPPRPACTSAAVEKRVAASDAMQRMMVAAASAPMSGRSTADVRRLHHHHASQQLRKRFRLVRRMAGRHVVHQRADGEHVSALVGGASHQQFGRDVRQLVRRLLASQRRHVHRRQQVLHAADSGRRDRQPFFAVLLHDPDDLGVQARDETAVLMNGRRRLAQLANERIQLLERQDAPRS